MIKLCDPMELLQFAHDIKLLSDMGCHLKLSCLVE